MSFKQCVIISSVDQRNILGGWFHVIINLQPLIPDKGNVFFPIGGVENPNLNRVPLGIWWCGGIMGLWRMRGGLFVREAFSWTLLSDDREPIGKMEGLPWNVRIREKLSCMTGHGISLGLDVSHRYCPIAASEGCLVNAQPLQTGTDS